MLLLAVPHHVAMVSERAHEGEGRSSNARTTSAPAGAASPIHIAAGWLAAGARAVFAGPAWYVHQLAMLQTKISGLRAMAGEVEGRRMRTAALIDELASSAR
jgi:hypothetical protein